MPDVGHTYSIPRASLYSLIRGARHTHTPLAIEASRALRIAVNGEFPYSVYCFAEL